LETKVQNIEIQSENVEACAVLNSMLPLAMHSVLIVVWAIVRAA